MAMHRSELKEFIHKVKSQGTHSSVMMADVLEELAQHIPLVLHISDEPKLNDGTKMVYDVIDPQREINEIIYELTHTETASVTVHDKGVTLNFTHIEIDDDLVNCYLTTFDGDYNLMLSPEEGFSEFCHTIK